MSYGKKKLLIALILAICFVLTIGGNAFAASFSDVQNHWAQAQIEKWADQGLIGGDQDGTFKPNKQVSRAEFVAMTNRAFDIKGTGAGVDFADVRATDWFYGEVSKAYYMAGYQDNTFKPNQSISRQEAAAILSRLLQLDTAAGSDTLSKFNDADKIPQWSRGAVAAVVSEGLMGGYPDQTFKPTNPITRAEAVVTLDRAIAKDVIPPITFDGVMGQVTLDGNPVEGAVVNLFAKDGKQVLQSMLTGKDGNYQFKVNPGTYDLTATKDKYVAYAAGVAVTKGTVKNLALIEGTVFNGTLTDKNNNPVKNGKLFFVANPTFITTTDNNGDFQITVAKGLVYSVWGYDKNNSSLSLVLIAENLSAEDLVQFLATLNAPYVLTIAGGGGGGGVGIAPKFTAASLTVNGSEIPITLSSNGLTGQINLSDKDDLDYVERGSVTVNIASTLKVESITGEYGSYSTALLPYDTQSLSANTKQTLDLITYLGNLDLDPQNDGISLYYLRTLFGDSVVIAGKLNNTNVVLTVILQSEI